MSVYMKFLFDFMSQLFSGLLSIFKGIFDGIVQIFNIPAYIDVLRNYSDEFSAGQWVLAVIAIIVVFALMGFILYLVFLLFRKYVRLRKSLVDQETLLEEIGTLNRDVLKLTQEKERLYAMKVSQLGLKPGESSEMDVEYDEDGNPIKKDEEEGASPTGPSRFYHLTEVDEFMKEHTPPETNNTMNLMELCDSFRNYAASKMGLYYKPKIIRLFLAAFSTTRLIILQGISGTGKTSMPYAWGKYINNDAVIASVQPSWRDRTELFGYFNEFTKKFNETEVLKKMYEASYQDIVYVTILDEMNIARVEYYFAEMLSILEMPSRDEWVIELVPTVWDNDPIRIPGGKLKIPDNMWYIGTINNDDSTFAVTDKVYDRAVPININEKGEKFEAPVTDSINLSSEYLESLFQKATEEVPVSEETMKKLEEMDNYVIEHFRIAFGNRIVKQIRDFIPAYKACGGDELEGLDYIIAHKILRKFEQLNLAYIRGEIDPFCTYLDKTFGKDVMMECKEYLQRLKKSM